MGLLALALVANTEGGAAGAFTPAAVVFLLGLIGGLAINLILPVPISPWTWTRFVALIPLAVGLLLFAWSSATFRRHKTALMPWSASAQLVRDGPYAFSRNPIYLASGVLYFGVALASNSTYVLVMLVVVLVLFDRRQIRREERYLEEKFGEEYRSYRAKVRRWV
jgi:protein-S-isoprenylcysteine O-methyltransferase Ste14